MTLLAIDPGVSGGIAWQIDGGLPAAVKMPETESDIFEQLDEIADSGRSPHDREVVATLEDVPAGMPGKGAAMVKLNANAAFIRGVLCALGVRLIMVRPAKWQKHFSLGTRASCASDTEWKNKLKAEAQRRFPALKVTLMTADALLLLEYAKETHRTTLKL